LTGKTGATKPHHQPLAFTVPPFLTLSKSYIDLDPCEQNLYTLSKIIFAAEHIIARTSSTQQSILGIQNKKIELVLHQNQSSSFCYGRPLHHT